MRHDFTYPSSLSHTKPHGELLGEFRSQCQQLMQQIEEESSDVDSSSSHDSTNMVCIANDQWRPSKLTFIRCLNTQGARLGVIVYMTSDDVIPIWLLLLNFY